VERVERVEKARYVRISGDGYRWRKVGEKIVKGNPHPRHYYRCTSSARCLARKHIQTVVDNSDVIVTYYKEAHSRCTSR
ncbi:putative WRKY transcription factor 32-like, partial [Trifolium medium]|nr:putative WRKY transcription factor 32-like [Trifolium medium]